MRPYYRAFIATLLLWIAPALALAAIDAKTLLPLLGEDGDAKAAVIATLSANADKATLRILKAMNDDALSINHDSGRAFVVSNNGAIDAISGEAVAADDGALTSAESVTVNNRLRSDVDQALAGLRLFDGNVAVRLKAAREMQSRSDQTAAALLARALASENDNQIKAILALAMARVDLGASDPARRLAAVKTLSVSSSSDVLNALKPLTDAANEPQTDIRIAAATSIREIETRIARSENIARLFSGVSLASILLLAALGLAITYGVMGVINMAHGELLMIGAYSTYFVQSLFRRYAPDAIDWYLLPALPVAFFTAALVGVAMERSVLRWLHGRPLESLLATWGLSLMCIQSVRLIFGAQNVEVANPSFMSGGVELAVGVILPWNRIVIIAFSVFVLLLIWALLNRTRLGLYVRAVTQHRPMAACVGIATARIDTLAFALGAGIAGLGGLALSQIANVGPDMGQGYIVDSFMVVVLGGVGQLAGAVWAALGLGVVSKFLEGWAGAVIAKIVVLIFIILFIQKRPQGLFALRGRALD